jgi:hypothetical protein
MGGYNCIRATKLLTLSATDAVVARKRNSQVQSKRAPEPVVRFLDGRAANWVAESKPRDDGMEEAV